MVAKVENFCISKKDKSISIGANERACINCIWYEQHYRMGRGNMVTWVPVSTGRCLLTDQPKGVLGQPCEEYET